jgi:hypothetical protein
MDYTERMPGERPPKRPWWRLRTKSARSSFLLAAFWAAYLVVIIVRVVGYDLSWWLLGLMPLGALMVTTGVMTGIAQRRESSEP